MKFLCPNCKAKYQIADDKIAGRTLKMDCRRCAHPIIIRGNSPSEAEAEPAPERASHPAPAPAGASARPSRRSGSHVGPAPATRSAPSARSSLGSEFRKAPAAAPPSRPSALDQWHVAINDVPVGPMKRDEVAKKIAMGAINGESLSWREGFDDWRPLKDIAELSVLLRRAAAPPTPAIPPRPGAPMARPSAGQQPRPARPPSSSSRPGMAPPQQERPAARGNVVPIGGRLGAAAAPAIDEDEHEGYVDDEPTRVGAAIDFERMDREARVEEDRVRADAERARADEDRRERERKRTDERARPPVTGEVSAEDAFDPFAIGAAPSSPGVSFPPRASAPPAAPAPRMSPAPAVPVFAPFPVVAPAAPPPRRGLPIGAWIAIAGAMAFGVVLAIMVGTHILTQPVQIAAAPTPAQPLPPAAPQPRPEVEQPAQPAPPVEDVHPDPEPPQAVQPGQHPPPPGTPPTPRTPRNPPGTAPGTPPGTAPVVGTQTPPPPGREPTRELDPEAQARLRRFQENGAEAAPVVVEQPNTPLAQERHGPTGVGLNADQIRSVVSREQAGVQRCYETATRALGSAPRLRIDVDLDIGATGTVTSARARGQDFGNISECIERTVRRWRFPGAGDRTQTSIPFVFQGRE